mgnify:CR=1 FL=1
MHATIVEFTAVEESGREYNFTGYLLATGEVCVPYETTHDGWFASIEDVDASGTAQITGRVVTTRHTRIAAITSVRGSAKEFGAEAVPESLRHWLVRDSQRKPRRF